MRLLQYLFLFSSFLLDIHQGKILEVHVYLFLIFIVIVQIRWYFTERRLTLHLLDLLLLVFFFAITVTSKAWDFFLIFVLVTTFWQMEDINGSLPKLLILLLGLVFTSGLYQILPSLLDLTILGSGLIGLYLLERTLREKDRLKEAAYYSSIQADRLSEDKVHLKEQEQILGEIRSLEERNRISRDIHDSAGHTLSTLVIQLEAISKLAESNKQPVIQEMAVNLRDFTKQGLEEVRQVIHDMKPKKYDSLSFIARLKELVRDYQANTGIDIYFNENRPSFELTTDQQEALYRALQESLANTAKHSQATDIRIQIHYATHQLIFNYKDNGQGTSDIIASVGLTGMKERIELAGGKLSHQSSPNQGFQTRIVLDRRI